MNTEYLKNDKSLKGSSSLFNYEEAFKRNLGLVSEKDQETLKKATIAIPGLGGVGGAHLMTLVRMGIGGFHLADQDTFQMANFNRQYGAKMSTLNANKAEVMAQEAMDINPDLRMKIWKSFIDENNIEEFLQGVDLVIDSLDFYAIEVRRLLYQKARQMNIPVITAGPLGFSCVMMTFTPDSMSFDEYFDLKDSQSHEEQLLRFTLGLSPKLYWLKYMDMTRVDKDQRTGPCSASAIALCSGFAAVEALKVILKKQRVHASPYSYTFDPFLMKFKRTRLILGNRGLVQRVKLAIARRIFVKRQNEERMVTRLLNPGARIPVRAVSGTEVVRREFRFNTSWHRPLAWQMLPHIVLEWAVIVGCFTVAMAMPNPWVWLGLAFVIGTRQTALQSFANLAVYRALSTHPRINEGLGNWLCAYPLFFSTESRRRSIVELYSPSDETKRCVFTNFGHYAFAALVIGLIVVSGLTWAMLCLWVLPRMIIMPILSRLKG